MNWRLDTGECRALMRKMEAESIHCVVTSPPYFGLRDYGSDEQIGLEETPAAYVEALVEVFREVRRVLRSDGTLWLNLGDSYNAGRDGGHAGGKKQADLPRHDGIERSGANVEGLKPKDLIGIPWMVAFALQQDGWYLRAEIIWAKPNPMPESVTDRPTRAHEQVFLFTKSERYFYDAHAVRETSVADHGSGVKERADNHQGGRSDFSTRVPWENQSGRNRRSVWEIATVPFKDAHFATFPPKLVEPCVQAGTSEEGVCALCGAPRQRMVSRVRRLDGEPVVEGRWDLDEGGRIGPAGVGHWRYETTSETLGWRPTCACGAPPGIEPDDLDLIESPIGKGGGKDPSRQVGRAGYLRPRADDAGTRTITRYQQRRYAEQLREVGLEECQSITGEISEDAWAHYIRTDRSGARPLPPALLERLLSDGLLEPVEPPEWELPPTIPATVFDPFAGAGTTGVVALRFGRSFVGVELSEKYAELAKHRIREDGPLFNVAAETPLTAGESA